MKPALVQVTNLLYSRIWGLEITTDLTGEMLVELAVTRHGRDLAGLWVDVDGMPAAFPMELATVRF